MKRFYRLSNQNSLHSLVISQIFSEDTDLINYLIACNNVLNEAEYAPILDNYMINLSILSNLPLFLSIVAEHAHKYNTFTTLDAVYKLTQLNTIIANYGLSVLDLLSSMNINVALDGTLTSNYKLVSYQINETTIKLLAI